MHTLSQRFVRNPVDGKMSRKLSSLPMRKTTRRAREARSRAATEAKAREVIDYLRRVLERPKPTNPAEIVEVFPEPWEVPDADDTALNANGYKAVLSILLLYGYANVEKLQTLVQDSQGFWWNLVAGAHQFNNEHLNDDCIDDDIWDMVVTFGAECELWAGM